MGHPQPSPVEARSNASFDALMWALSRPGLVQQLPEAGMLGIIEALIDRECRVFAETDAVKTAAERAGAELVDVPMADHVFVEKLTELSLLDRLSLGSDLYPDTGATLIAPAQLGTGPALRLSGPGVDGSLSICIGGVPAPFWTRRRDVMRYPMGFELFLIDGNNVVGFPRSTSVEVL